MDSASASTSSENILQWMASEFPYPSHSPRHGVRLCLLGPFLGPLLGLHLHPRCFGGRDLQPRARSELGTSMSSSPTPKSVPLARWLEGSSRDSALIFNQFNPRIFDKQSES